ncbi:MULTISPECIES: Do family serine endopeptidase [unclassified Neptuniibacter]|uniref:Do family serine endopeptidase n=1 Tax=unclassified Neptuniibacter TaxID=2630693 RepID=UPI000C4C2FFF|nr:MULTISPECIES: Do family serine endopeptidase [unclassified Neptuniibacter]MAY42316.1 transcriptional regulator [Oceanospirillaceae bacterium]|tara:strand:- start:34925 stop:36070 length:1146 start_codon:yes stop_codon:yes gene_type:complete
MRKLTFLFWPILSGILVAVILLQLFPSLLSTQPQAIEFKESTRPLNSNTNFGPVSYADAVALASPAVVNIYTQTIVQQEVHPLFDDPFFRNFFDADSIPQQERIQSSLGSGVILSPQGYIVTNNHVITGADSIVVALKDGRESIAKVIGTDPETDLAVLKISMSDLPSIAILESDKSRVGDVVLAIGNPFGVGQTVTMGIISATGRHSLGINTYEDFIQTDAAINPGNSGGALIDAYGNLIGINTAIFSKSGGSQGIGFAIPSNLTKQVMKDLIKHGRVVRGWLGIEIQELTPKLAESFDLETMQGLIIAGVFRNGPAHIAGLQPGDIMLSINDRSIINGRKSMTEIARFRPNETITLQILREGKELTINAKIGERPRAQE